MNNNIFMISDASYSSESQCAGLGVIDLYTGERYSHSLANVKDSYMSEYHALLYSIRIAIKNAYILMKEKKRFDTQKFMGLLDSSSKYYSIF